MPVENTNTVEGLNPAWPLNADPARDGAAQLRQLKVVLQNDVITGALLDAFADELRPVGTILTTHANTPPTLPQGATWEAFAPGRWLVGVGTDTDDNGDSLEVAEDASIGEYQSQLDVENLPPHTHAAGGLTTGAVGEHQHGAGTLTAAQAGGHRHDAVNNTFNGTDPIGNGFLAAQSSVGGGQAYTLTQSAVEPDRAPTSFEGVHSHTLSGSTAAGGSHSHTITGATDPGPGTGAKFGNIPPSVSVYYWRRTA